MSIRLKEPSDIAILADDLQSTSSVDSVAINQRQQLLADDLDSASSVSTPTFAEQGLYLKPTPLWWSSRSKLEWPFIADSYFNKPIGENANYVNLQNLTLQEFEVNYEHVVNVAPSDPWIPYYACNNGDTACFPPGVRCIGTTPVGIDLTPVNVQFPTNYIIPEYGYCSDIPNVTTDDCSTDNPASWTVPSRNNDYMFQNGGTGRCTAGGPIYGQKGAFALNNTYLKGDGTEVGGRYGGSAICMRGLTIKEQDILDDRPIPHAGALWIQPVITYYTPSTPDGQLYRWPARRSDAATWWPSRWGNITPMLYWDPTQLISNTIPGFVMGALVAIPYGITSTSLGIETEAGQKYFDMAQDYGFYLVNSAEAWSGNLHRSAMAHTPAAVEAFKSRWGHTISWNSERPNNYLYANPATAWGRWASDMNKIWQNLWLVDDNASTNIGGAGTLRMRPPAPPFND